MSAATKTGMMKQSTGFLTGFSSPQSSESTSESPIHSPSSTKKGRPAGHDLRDVSAWVQVNVLRVNDVEQTIRIGFELWTHWKAPKEEDELAPVTPYAQTDKERYVHVHDKEKKWEPKVQFLDLFETELVTERTVLLDRNNGDRYGIFKWIIVIDERLELHRFPFDRQFFKIRAKFFDCSIVAHANIDLDNIPPSVKERLVGFTDPKQPGRVMSNVKIVAEAESSLWRLRDPSKLIPDSCHFKIAEFNVKSVLSVAVISIPLERRSAYFIWNFVLILFFLVAICPMSVVIDLDGVHDRFHFVVALILTAAAFKFISSSLVPKTVYLTYLDRYNLISYFSMCFILCKDFFVRMLQINDVYSEDTITKIDAYSSLGYISLWVLFNLVCFILWKLEMLRLPWASVMSENVEKNSVIFEDFVENNDLQMRDETKEKAVGI
eukprot:m.203289 g.203289  ORF g.203289 m.203289 type:complete len:436 (+) comp32852_c4_seq2:132-1439(+)